MNMMIYNVSLLAGTALIGTGVALVSVPASLVTVGALVIALTLAGAYMSRKG